MKSRLSQHAQHVLCLARELTSGTAPGSILPDHLALGILDADRSVAVRLLLREGADLDRLRDGIAARVATARRMSDQTGREVQGSIVELFTLRLLSERTGRVMDLAYKEAISLGDPYVGTEHMLLGLLSGGDPALCTIFKREQVTYDAIRQQLESRRIHDTAKLDDAEAEPVVNKS